jgi:hypothetical protein
VSTSPQDPIVERCLETAQAVSALRQLTTEIEEFESDVDAFSDRMDGITPAPQTGTVPPPITIPPLPGPGVPTPPSSNRRTWEERWVHRATYLGEHTLQVMSALRAAAVLRRVPNAKLWVMRLRPDIGKLARVLENGGSPVEVFLQADDAWTDADEAVYIVREVPKASECQAA